MFFQGQRWISIGEGAQEGQGATLMPLDVIRWLNGLPRLGTMAAEPAYIINFGGQSAHNVNQWQRIDGVQRWGVDFARKRDAMMFKLAFQNYKGPDDLRLWHPVVEPREPYNTAARLRRRK